MSASDAAQRVGMAESDLRSINGIPPRMLIKAGSALIVPRSATMRQDVTEHVADNGQVSLTPEIVTHRTTVRAGKRDSVAALARRYRVSAASLAGWNDVKVGATFHAGAPVVLFLPVSLKASTSTASHTPGKKAVQKTARAPTPQPSRRGGTPSKKIRR